MKGHKETDCWKKVRNNKENERDNVAEDNEDTVLMATSGCNEGMCMWTEVSIQQESQRGPIN